MLRRALRLFAFASVVVVAAAPAKAQSSADLASRRVLLEQAQKARGEGRHADALDRASRAGTIKMTASVRRFIAEEQAAIGRLAEALGSADECIVDANQEPPSPNVTAVRAGCVDLRDELKTKVGEVVIEVASPAPPGLVVKVGGAVVNPALYGAAYVVTPGHVRVEATAAGYEPYVREVDVAARAAVHVAVALSAEPTASRPEPPTPTSTSTSTEARRPAETRRERNPVWLAVAGGGAALLAGGAIAWLVSDGMYNDLHARCTGPSPCDPASASSDRSSITTLDALANVGIIGGAVVAAAGATLYFALPRETAAVSPQLSATRGGATFGFHGAF